MFGSLRNNIGIARNSTGSNLHSMHKIESRETSNRKYLSKTILACRERQAKNNTICTDYINVDCHQKLLFRYRWLLKPGMRIILLRSEILFQKKIYLLMRISALCFVNGALTFVASLWLLSFIFIYIIFDINSRTSSV